MSHISVLLQETIEGLDLKPGEVVVDATLGEGGHSQAVCELIGPTGLLVGLDADQRALDRASKNLASCDSQKVFIEGNFRDLASLLAKNSIGKVDAVIFDLGVNSSQLDSDDRGFSFRFEEPLLMTLRADHENSLITAYDIVNTWSEENLADVIYGYGEERFSRPIAKAIAEARKNQPVKTTKELVEIIESAVPAWYRRGRIHSATRTFQALRIAVNDELGALSSGLEQAFQVLSDGGRIAVISFHSLEARIVKNFFVAKVKNDEAEFVGSKVILPSRIEQKNNPRSRSAQLRIIKKI